MASVQLGLNCLGCPGEEACLCKAVLGGDEACGM